MEWVCWPGRRVASCTGWESIALSRAVESMVEAAASASVVVEGEAMAEVAAAAG
jgi:hypothetical protein